MVHLNLLPESGLSTSHQRGDKRLVQTQIEHVRGCPIFWFQDFDGVMVFTQHLRDSTVRIFDIAYDARATDAGFHAGREQAGFETVNTKGAFISGLRFMVDESRIIRTGLHAVGAAHAARVVDYHNAVFALESGLYRANGDAGDYHNGCTAAAAGRW